MGFQRPTWACTLVLPEPGLDGSVHVAEVLHVRDARPRSVLRELREEGGLGGVTALGGPEAKVGAALATDLDTRKGGLVPRVITWLGTWFP
jgi:hypothetical protein